MSYLLCALLSHAPVLLGLDGARGRVGASSAMMLFGVFFAAFSALLKRPVQCRAHVVLETGDGKRKTGKQFIDINLHATMNQPAVASVKGTATTPMIFFSALLPHLLRLFLRRAPGLASRYNDLQLNK